MISETNKLAHLGNLNPTLTRRVVVGSLLSIGVVASSASVAAQHRRHHRARYISSPLARPLTNTDIFNAATGYFNAGDWANYRRYLNPNKLTVFTVYNQQVYSHSNQDAVNAMQTLVMNRSKFHPEGQPNEVGTSLSGCARWHDYNAVHDGAPDNDALSYLFYIEGGLFTYLQALPPSKQSICKLPPSG